MHDLYPTDLHRAPSADSAILRHYVQWQPKKDAANALDMDSPEFDRAMKDLLAHEAAIFRLPAQTVLELAAKVLVADDDGNMANASKNAQTLVAEMLTLVEGSAEVARLRHDLGSIGKGNAA